MDYLGGQLKKSLCSCFIQPVLCNPDHLQHNGLASLRQAVFFRIILFLWSVAVKKNPAKLTFAHWFWIIQIVVLAIEHLVRCARYNTGMLAGIWCWQSSGAISSGDWGVSADRWPEPPKLGKATEIVQNRPRSEIVVGIGSFLLIPIIGDSECWGFYDRPLPWWSAVCWGRRGSSREKG